MPMFNELVIENDAVKKTIPVLWKDFTCLKAKSQRTGLFTTEFSVNFILLAMENPMCSFGSKPETAAQKKMKNWQ